MMTEDFIQYCKNHDIYFWFSRDLLHYYGRKSEININVVKMIEEFKEVLKETYQSAYTDEEICKRMPFWKEEFSKPVSILDLPVSYCRQNHKGMDNEIEKLKIEEIIGQGIEKMAQNNKISPVSILLSAFSILLYRYTYDENIILGIHIRDTDFLNINYANNDNLFSPILLLKTVVSEISSSLKTTIDCDNKLKSICKNSLPIDKLKSEISYTSINHYHDLFQVLFVYQSPGDITEGIVQENKKINDDQELDIKIIINRINNEYVVELHYSKSLFHRNIIKRLLEQYRIILYTMITDSSIRVKDIEILTEYEKKMLFNEWNKTEMNYSLSEPIDVLFEKATNTYPEKTAVIYRNESITYNQLNKKANQLAHKLQRLGICKDMVVGIMLPRSIDTIISILAVLKVGGIYVPLDLSYPINHIQYISNQTKLAILLTSNELKNKINLHKNNNICLDSDWNEIARESNENLNITNSVENICVILYTSGSTGEPKGVAHRQKQFLNRFTWLWNYYPLKENEVFCQRTNMNFIPSVTEYFLGLLKGKPTIIIEDEVIRDAGLLIKKLSHYKVTRIIIVPSLLQLLLETDLDLEKKLPDLSLWTTCGEPLTLKLFTKFRKSLPQAILHNDYGATEVNGIMYFDSTMKDVISDNVPLGKPIANVNAYILDQLYRPVPVGVPGSLFIGGICIPDGYYKRPDLTEIRFISNPFQKDIKSKLYNMGDIVKYSEDGSIEYIGRKDHQVKLHGIRIELNEIETAIGKFPGVRECAVAIYDKNIGGKQLVAFVVVPDRNIIGKQDIQAFLKQLIPTYMIPTKYYYIDSLPRTPNGKIDRIYLSKYENMASIIEDNIKVKKAEQNYNYDNISEKVVGILDSILETGITKSDFDIKFVDLGIDSFGSIEFIKQINSLFNVNLSPIDLYDHSTIALFITYLNTQINLLKTSRMQRGESENTANLLSDDIAIIGISGRFPEADNYLEFWKNLKEGKASIAAFPVGRDKINDEEDIPEIQIGAFLDKIDDFEPEFFGISPREANYLDPQQRIFLEESWKVFEDAGYSPSNLSGEKIGVFVGVRRGGYEDQIKNAVDALNPYILTGNDPAILASRLSYCLNLRGPCIAIDTACSSSLSAVHIACQSIKSGETSMSIAAGVSINLSRDFKFLSYKLGMLSEQYCCKTFDDSANGFVFGEGIGVVLLKAKQKAIEDNDHIYAVIKATGINNDGRTNGITAPSKESQINLITDIYDKNKINPETISYMEAHGTGTKLGDPIEVGALTDCFSRYTNKKQFCAIGSVKTNIGHTIASAGIIGLIKICLMIQNREMVPSLNFKNENKLIRFQTTPFYVNTEHKKWDRGKNARRAALSSFGFSGTNVHLVLEEFEEEKKGKPKGDYFIIPFSAKTDSSLYKLIINFTSWLGTEGDKFALDDICYTLQTGRTHFEKRFVLVVSNMQELLDILSKQPDSISNINEIKMRYEKSIFKNIEYNYKSQTLYEILDNRETSSYEYYLTLALIYLIGDTVNWQKYFDHRSYRRIPLPTYPFLKERYWCDGIISDTIQKDDGKKNAKTEILSLKFLKQMTRKKISLVLRISEDKITDEINFTNLGIDSITTFELLIYISELIDLEIDENTLIKFPTLNKLTHYLWRLIDAKKKNTGT